MHRVVRLDYPIGRLIYICKLEELRFLFVEEVGESVNALFVVIMVLRLEAVLEKVGNSHSSFVGDRLALALQGVGQEVNGLGEIMRPHVLRFLELLSLVVL